MSHPTLQELTEAVHGFRPAPAHLDDCPECGAAAERLREELDLLRRAEAPVARPKRRAWAAWPVAAAAAALLTITVFLMRPQGGLPTSPAAAKDEREFERLLRGFLEGTEEEAASARAALRAVGPAALPALSEERGARPNAARAEALGDLIFELKEARAGAEGKASFGILRSKELTFDLRQVPLTEAVEFLRSAGAPNLILDARVGGVGFLVDQAIAERPLTLTLQGVKLRRALELLCAQAGLDYDFRYGAIFLARPGRLWSPTPPPAPRLPAGQEESIRARLVAAVEKSDRSELSALEKLGPFLIPLARRVWEEIQDPSGLTLELIGRIEDAARAPLPAANLWSSQVLSGESRETAERLRSAKPMDVDFRDVSYSDVLGFLRQTLGVNIEAPGSGTPELVGLVAKGLTPPRLLELLTLPYGLDARIEGGIVILFDRARP